MKIASILRREYHGESLSNLKKARLNALKKMTPFKEKLFAEYFQITNIEELALSSPFIKASSLAASYYKKEEIDIANSVKPEYVKKSLSSIMLSSPLILMGVDEDRAFAMKKLGIKSVMSMAKYEAFHHARIICLSSILPHKEASVYAKYFKQFPVFPLILKERLDAFKTISPKEAEDMFVSFNIKTVYDMASFEPYQKAKAILEGDYNLFSLNPPYETYESERLLEAPIDAIAGLNKYKAAIIRRIFRVNNIKQLGKLKEAMVSEEIIRLASSASSDFENILVVRPNGLGVSAVAIMSALLFILGGLLALFLIPYIF